MANIASCWIAFRPMSAAFATDIASRLARATGVESGDIGSTPKDGGVRFDFFGKWTCEVGWGMIEELLADKSYTFREELLGSEIDGRGTEPGCRYREGIKKFPSRSHLQRQSK